MGAVAAAATEAGAAVEMQDKKIPRKTQESLLGNGSTFRKKGRNQKKKKKQKLKRVETSRRGREWLETEIRIQQGEQIPKPC